MSAAPTYFNSTFKHGVDEKRRLQIPAKWRPEEEGVQLTMVVWPKHQAGTCLRVLPPEKFAKWAADIDKIPNGDPTKVVLKRYVGSKSVQVTLDKAGRICVPDEMANAAGIKEEAILVGLIDQFEIWNPTRFEQVEAMDAVLSLKAFEMME
jgi:MraZ protein